MPGRCFTARRDHSATKASLSEERAELHADDEMSSLTIHSCHTSSSTSSDGAAVYQWSSPQLARAVARTPDSWNARPVETRSMLSVSYGIRSVCRPFPPPRGGHGSTAMHAGKKLGAITLERCTCRGSGGCASSRPRFFCICPSPSPLQSGKAVMNLPGPVQSSLPLQDLSVKRPP